MEPGLASRLEAQTAALIYHLGQEKPTRIVRPLPCNRCPLPCNSLLCILCLTPSSSLLCTPLICTPVPAALQFATSLFLSLSLSLSLPLLFPCPFSFSFPYPLSSPLPFLFRFPSHSSPPSPSASPYFSKLPCSQQPFALKPAAKQAAALAPRCTPLLTAHNLAAHYHATHCLLPLYPSPCNPLPFTP
jgi:hypothetical protein